MQRPVGHKQAEDSSKSTGKTLFPQKQAVNTNTMDVSKDQAKENDTFCT